jgi:hypothetical protein
MNYLNGLKVIRNWQQWLYNNPTDDDYKEEEE